jgi:hypothetical protein
MSLPIAAAERILRERFGEPAKPPTQYVIGFKTPLGRVLALHRDANETRIWFQPPAPALVYGITLMATSAKNSNLDGPLSSLNSSTALRVEIDGEPALRRFLDWYEGSSGARTPASKVKIDIDPRRFREAFARFQRLIATKDKGNAFTNFQEGVAGVMENYKPRLRDHALRILAFDGWSANHIGSGVILQHAIDAIEIQVDRTLTNNLVFWQNRYGHANRDHRALLEAASNPKQRRELEYLLFDLYRGGADEGLTFDRLSELTGAKYPLLAYLYFLKDMDQFMPIQPTGFDRAFREIGIDFVTLRQCGWENYASYNAILSEMRPILQVASGLKNIRLIDAHSFCWIFATLLRLESEDSLASAGVRKDAGRIIGGREKSIIAMRFSVEDTVKNSNGQIVQRTIKNKELRMTSAELEKLLASLLHIQGDRCALTGIPFQFHGLDSDKNLLPSLDRIDSDGHYESGNLQVVCQFINFWKGDSDNSEFQRLLMLVRDLEESK